MADRPARLHGPFRPSQFDQESWALRYVARPRIARLIFQGRCEHVFSPLEALAGYRERFVEAESAGFEPFLKRDARAAAADFKRLLPHHGSRALQHMADDIERGFLDSHPDAALFLMHHARLIEVFGSEAAHG